jgi:hypothetical protein
MDSKKPRELSEKSRPEKTRRKNKTKFKKKRRKKKPKRNKSSRKLLLRRTRWTLNQALKKFMIY